MFTPEERERLRGQLVEAARDDPRITGGAITGSAAADAEDRWSDIDLAFGLRHASEMPAVLADWTARLYDRHGALDHLDVSAGRWVYRVFFLHSTLQVDLAFAPQEDFGARAPTFRLVFGRASEPGNAPPPRAEQLIGMAWLYALHARSSIARGKLWQAEYVVSAVRDHVFALACLRLGLPAREGRGMDRLPHAVTDPLAGAIVARIEAAELSRAFGVAIEALIAEIGLADATLAARLADPLRQLA